MSIFLEIKSPEKLCVDIKFIYHYKRLVYTGSLLKEFCKIILLECSGLKHSEFPVMWKGSEDHLYIFSNVTMQKWISSSHWNDSKWTVSLLSVIHTAKPQTCINLLSVMQNGYIEICAPLGFYEEQNGNSVPFKDNLLVSCSRIKQSSILDSLPLEDVTDSQQMATTIRTIRIIATLSWPIRGLYHRPITSKEWTVVQ